MSSGGRPFASVDAPGCTDENVELHTSGWHDRDRRGRAVPKLVGINHIALEVGDLEEALAFWGSIFGPLELRSEIGRTAFIDMGDQFIAVVEGRSQPRDQARQ
jgi:catechol-2,3-dioxygenase